MKKNKMLWLGFLICLLPFIAGIIYYDRLPDVMATHFDMSGKANGYTDKNLALFGLPLGMTLVFLLMYFVTIKDPKHKNHDKKLNNIVFLLIPVFNVLMTALMIEINLGKDIDIGMAVRTGIGVLFIIVGNYLPKVKRNYTMGLKLPWTLHSDFI